MSTHCYDYNCLLAGVSHQFEMTEGAIRHGWKHRINVYGCGLVLDTKNKLWIFFTLNGKLMGELVR
jgi:hypothetical protein